jgi:hypothetical protein
MQSSIPVDGDRNYPGESNLSAKFSFLLFAVGWVLLAAATLPAQASGILSPASVTPLTVETGTFPLFDTGVPASQAHLIWLAAREDAGMQATIDYIASANGSTAVLTSIHGDVVTCRKSISLGKTPADIRNSLEDLRRITESFREETDARLRETGGNPEELRKLVRESADNPDVIQAEDRYWETRMRLGLSDFDQWVQQADSTVTQLQEGGYETASSQEKLTEITTMRTTLETAFRARNDTDIDQARTTIHSATVAYAQGIRATKKIVTAYETGGNLLDQSEGVLTRSGMMNANLTSLGINCTNTRDRVEAGRAQVAATKEQIDAGDIQGARTTLAQLNRTVLSLRDDYRAILIREDLPDTTAQGVLSVAQSLDVLSVRLGTF